MSPNDPWRTFGIRDLLAYDPWYSPTSKPLNPIGGPASPQLFDADELIDCDVKPAYAINRGGRTLMVALATKGGTQWPPQPPLSATCSVPLKTRCTFTGKSF